MDEVIVIELMMQYFNDTTLYLGIIVVVKNANK